MIRINKLLIETVQCNILLCVEQLFASSRTCKKKGKVSSTSDFEIVVFDYRIEFTTLIVTLIITLKFVKILDIGSKHFAIISKNCWRCLKSSGEKNTFRRVPKIIKKRKVPNDRGKRLSRVSLETTV